MVYIPKVVSFSNTINSHKKIRDLYVPKQNIKDSCNIPLCYQLWIGKKALSLECHHYHPLFFPNPAKQMKNEGLH